LYVVPVALAARWSSGWWGVALAAFMPMVHLGFMVLRKTPWPMTDSFINTGIRMAALVGFAVLIDRVTRQERELKVLRGLLPVCCFCKRIRTAEEKWEPIEFYITERSEARFTHTICPEEAARRTRPILRPLPNRLNGFSRRYVVDLRHGPPVWQSVQRNDGSYKSSGCLNFWPTALSWRS
jgi:hypothetical protein